MTLESIKAEIAEGIPVLTTINGKASVIIGYDDEKQQFLIRPCGGEKEWVNYSLVKDEYFVLK
jgi:hypothetical protein